MKYNGLKKGRTGIEMERSGKAVEETETYYTDCLKSEAMKIDVKPINSYFSSFIFMDKRTDPETWDVLNRKLLTILDESEEERSRRFTIHLWHDNLQVIRSRVEHQVLHPDLLIPDVS